MRGGDATHDSKDLIIEKVISETLNIDASNIQDSLSYQSIPQWDSLRHISLLLALESATGVSVEEETIPLLQDVASIKAFFTPQIEKEKINPFDVGGKLGNRQLD